MIKGLKPNFHIVKSHDNRNNMNNMDNDDETNPCLRGNTINDNSFNEDESGYNNSNKMNTLNFNSTITPTPNSIALLDDIMKARDELFEKQLGDGLKAHRKLAGLVMK